MKKNISINLQGLIFHIEEDGYEVLGRYLAEVRAHFSGYPGHEEIVSDIEGRIAELFAARLSSTKQVITLEDVKEMTTKMGRVSEFQSAEELDEDELQDAIANGRMPQNEGSSNSSDTNNGPRRLYRDMTNRKIAGVAAGIARYFVVNPLWVRLAFIALLFLPNILFHEYHGGNGNLDLPGISLLLYIILWIALPKRYDAPLAGEDPTFKKLFRDTDNGKVGGVAAGLAAYFKIDVVAVRILFIIFVFAGGFGIPLYIILWILVPEAKSVSDRMRMRGDAVTLSGIDSNLRNQAFEAGATSSNRPVGTFLEELFRNLRPLINGIGALIRVAAGLLLMTFGFLLLLGSVIGLGAGLGLFTSEAFQIDGIPAYTLFGDFPIWFLLSAFLTVSIPALAMLLSGVGLLMRRTILRRSVALSMLGLWLLGVIGSTAGGVQISRNYQEEGESTQEQLFPTITKKTVKLDLTYVNRGEWAGSELVAADSGQAISITRKTSAKGATFAEAEKAAATSVLYRVRTISDSTLNFDNHFRYAPGARLRDQELMLTLRLPRDRNYRMTDDFARWLGAEFFMNSIIPSNIERYTFRMRGDKLECINCPASALEDGKRDNEDNDDDENFGETIEIGDEDANVKVELGKVGFPTELSDYDSGRRTFSVQDFTKISASGAYRVYVRQGDSYKVEAAGTQRDLDNMQVNVTGDELRIRSRRGSFFGFSESRKPVLVRIQVPAVKYLELSGACRADVAGFRGTSLQVEQSGASTASLDVQVAELSLELSGACNTAVQGRANTLNVEGSGVCKVDALNLDAERATVDLTGASRARVKVSQRLNASATGASHVLYAGNPNSVETDDSPGSSVRPIDDAKNE